jgi:hypothetical protein
MGPTTESQMHPFVIKMKLPLITTHTKVIPQAITAFLMWPNIPLKGQLLWLGIRALTKGTNYYFLGPSDQFEKPFLIVIEKVTIVIIAPTFQGYSCDVHSHMTL